MRPLERALTQSIWCPYKKKKFAHIDMRHVSAQRKDRMRTGKMVAASKPRREALGEIKPADTLILDF